MSKSWKNYPWSQRVLWPLNILFETTPKWKLERGAGFFLLEPEECMPPVVLWAPQRHSFPHKMLTEAWTEGYVYTKGFDIALVTVPTNAIACEVDAAFTDDRFLDIEMPLLVEDRAARWIQVMRLLEQAVPEQPRISSSRCQIPEKPARLPDEPSKMPLGTHSSSRGPTVQMKLF